MTKNIKTPPRPKWGRPSTYKKKYCQMLYEHMAKGHSFRSFAHIVKVDYSTIYQWEKSNPEFSHARKMGESADLELLESVALKMAQGELPKTAQASPLIFMMKQRHPDIYGQAQNENDRNFVVEIVNGKSLPD